MSNRNKYGYELAIAYNSDKGFVELVQQNLNLANYQHNSLRSRVTSVRGEFVKFLSSLVRQQKELLKDNLINSSESFETMHELFVAVSLGNWVVPSDILRRFINGIANAVGYKDMPTNSEISEIYGILCADFEGNNRYITAELMAKHTAKVDARREATTATATAN